MRPPHLIRGGQGFTLIELLTAMILMALVVVPMFGIIRVSQSKSDRRLKETMETHLLMRSMLTHPLTETTVIDTISPSGFQFRLIDSLVTAGQDTKRCIIIMSRHGDKWDTITTVITGSIGKTPVLLR